MAQHMGVDPFADPRPLCIAAKSLPSPLRSKSDRFCALRDEQCWMIIMPYLEILFYPYKGRLSEIDFAGLIALANSLRYTR